MSDRVSPTDRIRGHIDELFAQDKRLPEILEDVGRLSAMLLEAEITESLGRDRYPRRECSARAAASRQRTDGHVRRT